MRIKKSKWHDSKLIILDLTFEKYYTPIYTHNILQIE